MTPDAALDTLRERAREAGGRAHTPYSGRREGAAFLLADGPYVPGARVENASFPLTIPALLAAYVAVRGAGRAADVRAVATSHPLLPGEPEWLVVALAEEGGPRLRTVAPDALAVDGPLPAPTATLDLFLTAPAPLDEIGGVRLALDIAKKAHTPASGFPVGAVLEVEGGRLVPGVNVETADWTRGLCAERAALATAVSYGVGGWGRLFLACPRAPDGSPCGGCRQVLAELLPGHAVVMGRGDAPPEATTPEALLPGAFLAAQLGV